MVIEAQGCCTITQLGRDSHNTSEHLLCAKSHIGQCIYITILTCLLYDVDLIILILAPSCGWERFFRGRGFSFLTSCTLEKSKNLTPPHTLHKNDGGYILQSPEAEPGGGSLEKEEAISSVWAKAWQSLRGEFNIHFSPVPKLCSAIRSTLQTQAVPALNIALHNGQQVMQLIQHGSWVQFLAIQRIIISSQ